MSEGGIELKELTYGQLNNLRENDSNASGDRRRTDPVTALRIATERAFSRDTLRGVSEFYGIVVGRRTITTAIYDYRPTILNSFSTITQTDVAKDEEPVLHDVNINQFLYKVYIPELQPLCPPTSFDDPIIFNYPDVGVDFPLGGKTDIALGAFVTVRYEDPGNLFGPKIIKVSDEVLRIKNLSVDGAGNQRIFKGGIAATIGIVGQPRQGTLDPKNYDHVIPASSGVIFANTPSVQRLLSALQQAAESKGKWIQVSSGWRDGYNQARIMLDNHHTHGANWMREIYGPKSSAVYDIFNAQYDRETTIQKASQISWIANNKHYNGAMDIRWRVYDSAQSAKSGNAGTTPPPFELVELLVDAMGITPFRIFVEKDHFHIDPNVQSSSVTYAETVTSALKAQIGVRGLWDGGTLTEIRAVQESEDAALGANESPEELTTSSPQSSPLDPLSDESLFQVPG